MRNLKLAVAGLLVLWSVAVIAHNCIHEELVQKYANEPRVVAPQNYGNQFTTSATGSMNSLTVTWQSIRIKFDTTYLPINSDSGRACYSTGQSYSVGTPAVSNPATCSASVQDNCVGTCLATDVVTQTKLDFIQTSILDAAKGWLQSALAVKRVSGNLILQPGTCIPNGGVTIPTSYTTTGAVDTDLVIFVTARPTFANTIAWAMACQSDAHYRPVAGHVNFGMTYLDTSAAAYQSQLSVAIHELTHVLGFSSAKYSEFVDPTSGTVKASNTVVQTVSVTGANSATYSVQQIITPTVLSWVRSHYNCSSITGARLEDGGGAGTAGSHWEKKLMWNEYMTGEIDLRPVLSGLTLSYLQDTGYYQANLSVSSPLLWGYGKGCNFYNGPCTASSWGTANSYTCSTDGNEACIFDRSAIGRCSLATWNPALPSQFQYFSGSTTLGGVDAVSDYCTMYLAYSTQNGYCDIASNMFSGYDTSYGDTFGPGSKCFSSSLVATGYSKTGQNPNPHCYKTSCNSEGKIVLTVRGNDYVCPIAGGSVSVTGYNGVITCPPATDLCSKQDIILAAPAFTAISPSAGSDRGNVRVIITGSGFTSASSVAIGDVSCEPVVVDSDSQIRCVTGAKLNVTGAFAVRITTNNGVAIGASAFTYSTSYPYITSISPNAAYSGSLSRLTITGGNFASSGYNILLGSVTCISPNMTAAGTTITCKTPAGTGTVDVQYTDSTKTGYLVNAFTFRSLFGNSAPSSATPLAWTTGLVLMCLATVLSYVKF